MTDNIFDEDFDNLQSYLQTQIICEKLKNNEFSLANVPEKYINEIICNVAVDVNTKNMLFIPTNDLKYVELCVKVALINEFYFDHVPLRYRYEALKILVPIKQKRNAVSNFTPALLEFYERFNFSHHYHE